MPKKLKKKKIKTKIIPAIKSQRALEVKYRRQLNKLGKALIQAVNEEVLAYIETQQETYIADGIGDQLGLIFKKLTARFTGTATFSFAKSTAEQFVNKVGISNKKKFDRTVQRATGVDLGAIITSEGLEDFVTLSVNKNVGLIKSLPEEYLKQVETIVNNGVVSGARFSTIKKEIISKTGANAKLAGRIKTIAMNEIQTINAQMTLRRSETLGIKEGLYRTSEDERVRQCHKELNGVRYDLSKGAWSKTCQKFIQPGITDINCRCSYSSIINIDETGAITEKEPPKTKAKAKNIIKKIKQPSKKKAVYKKLTPQQELSQKKINLMVKMKKSGASLKEREIALQKLIKLEEMKAQAKINQLKAKPIKKKEPKHKAPAKKAIQKQDVNKEVKQYKNLNNTGEGELKKTFKFNNKPMPADLEDYIQESGINEDLRSGKVPDMDKEAVKNLDVITNKKELKTDVQLHRALYFKEKDLDTFLEGMDVGTVHSDKGFMSTTISEISEKQVSVPDSEKVVMKILADKDTKGTFLPGYASAEEDPDLDEDEKDDLSAIKDMVDAEKEFLMPRDTKLQVVGEPIRKRGITTITMRVINE